MYFLQREPLSNTCNIRSIAFRAREVLRQYIHVVLEYDLEFCIPFRCPRTSAKLAASRLGFWNIQIMFSLKDQLFQFA